MSYYAVVGFADWHQHGAYDICMQTCSHISAYARANTHAHSYIYIYTHKFFCSNKRKPPNIVCFNWFYIKFTKNIVQIAYGYIIVTCETSVSKHSNP